MRTVPKFFLGGKKVYPITLNLKNKPVLIIGGGKIAARKIKGLLGEGADMTVISPILHKDIKQEMITWIQKEYEAIDIRPQYQLIFACTDNNSLNEQILSDALPSQLVNVVSNKEKSDFYNMSMIKHKGIKIGITTEGASPKVTKETRIKLQKWLNKNEE